MGFRGWLYRWITACFGLVGLLAFLSLLEVSRLYGLPALAPIGEIGLGLSFLLLMTAFLKVWSWKRYGALSVIVAAVTGLPYVALRPEMLRDDVLKQLVNPPLTADLLFYRGIALRNDAERETKIKRLQFVYGLLNTIHTPIPEAK